MSSASVICSRFSLPTRRPSFKPSSLDRISSVLAAAVFSSEMMVLVRLKAPSAFSRSVLAVG
jgi:hypothetical protein